MCIEEIVERYLHLAEKLDFIRYEKAYASRIQISLNNAYQRKSPEPNMVELIEGIINKLNGLSVFPKGFRVLTRGIFVHGNMSKVSFEYFGQNITRELGDMIFIITIAYSGKKYFERMTISQFKKDNVQSRWDLGNKGQLYFLSRFPPFVGEKRSLIPSREFCLPNYTGCLGSYCFLLNPGEMIFVSAPRLDSHIGSKKSIGLVQLSHMSDFADACYRCPIPPDPTLIRELIGYWRKLLEAKFVLWFFPFSIRVLGNTCYACNLYDFADKYLRSCIGEPIFNPVGSYNVHALSFLHEMLCRVRQKAQRDGDEDVWRFVDEFFRYPYLDDKIHFREDEFADYIGGGIGIVHTLIDIES